MLASKRNVLLVEDHEDSRMLVSLLLQRAGYQVTAAASVAEAWQLTHQKKFDLYLLDRGLGDGLGLTLCEQVRQAQPMAPIVFCTGACDWEDQQAAFQAGADAYVTKPFDNDHLVQTLNGLLQP